MHGCVLIKLSMSDAVPVCQALLKKIRVYDSRRVALIALGPLLN